MNFVDKPSKIRSMVSERSLLQQLMEECAEVIVACNKVIRSRSEDNPTPVKADKALESLWEQLADIAVVEGVFRAGFTPRIDYSRMIDRKIDRWLTRLEAQNEDRDVRCEFFKMMHELDERW